LESYAKNPGNFVLLLLEKRKNLMQISFEIRYNCKWKHNENKTIFEQKHQMVGIIVWTI